MNPESLQEVTDLLLMSENIDKEYAVGCSTADLYKIVKSNNLNMLKYALTGKRNLSAKALACVLWYAISHEYHEIAKLLVEYGADVNQRGIRHHFYDPRISLLSWAAYYKNKHAVKLLIKHGAKLNDYDLLGMGALYFAISAKRVKIARILLENGANINHEDDHGNSMFHIAAGTGVSDMINLVRKFSHDVNVKNNYGQNALHYAIQGRYDFKHIVSLLVRLGVSVDGQDNYEETPLHYALSLRKNRMAIALMDCDANTNIMSKNKIFPLYLAVTAGCSYDIIRNILFKGANINEQIIDGETVLHSACRDEDNDKIAFLLAYKADINILNKDGDTPLFLIKSKTSMAAHTLLRHIANLKLSGFFILEKNLEFIENCVDLHEYFQQCLCTD